MNSPHVNAWIRSPLHFQQGRPTELISPSLAETSPGYGRPISPGPHARELHRPISPGPQGREWRGLSSPGPPVFRPPIPLSPWGALPPPGTWGFNERSGTPPPVAQGTVPFQTNIGSGSRMVYRNPGPVAVPPPLYGEGQYVASPAPMLSPSPSRARVGSPSPTSARMLLAAAGSDRSPNGMSNDIVRPGTTYGDPTGALAEAMQAARGEANGSPAMEWVDSKLSDLILQKKLLALNERQLELCSEQQAYLKIPTQSRCLATDGSSVLSSPNSKGMQSLIQADHEALRHQVDQLRKQRFENEIAREEMNLAIAVERRELNSAREQLEMSIEGKMKEIKALSEGVEDGMRKSLRSRGIEEAAAAKISDLEQKCEDLQQQLAKERQLTMEAIRDRQEAQKMHQDAEDDLSVVKEISGQVLSDCRSLQQRVQDLRIGPEEKAAINGYVGPSESTTPTSRLLDRRSMDEPRQLDSDALSQQRESMPLLQDSVAEEANNVRRDLMSMQGRIKDLERELTMVHSRCRKSQALPQSRRSSAPGSPSPSPSRDRIRTASLPALGGDMHSSWPEVLLKHDTSDQPKALRDTWNGDLQFDPR